MKPLIVAPSLLAADWGRFAADAQAAVDAGAAWLHIDVMDGHFVPNISFGAGVVRALKRALPNAFMDVHLMISAPERWVDTFADAGADGITVHPEATPHVHRALAAIRERKLKVGMALNPLTPTQVLEDALEMLDLALVMSVDPGFGGQRYLPSAEPRLQRLRRAIDTRNPACRLQVDGGIDAHTGKAAVAAGADVLVAGTAVFGHTHGIAAGVQALMELSPS